MSVLENVVTALATMDFPIGLGNYPMSSTGVCGKIVFNGEDKPLKFLGGTNLNAEAIKITLRGNEYLVLEEKANRIKVAMIDAGFILTSGLENVEPNEGESFMQIAVQFKLIK